MLVGRLAGLVLPVIGGLDSLGSQPERPTQTLPKKP